MEKNECVCLVWLPVRERLQVWLWYVYCSCCCRIHDAGKYCCTIVKQVSGQATWKLLSDVSFSPLFGKLAEQPQEIKRERGQKTFCPQTQWSRSNKCNTSEARNSKIFGRNTEWSHVYGGRTQKLDKRINWQQWDVLGNLLVCFQGVRVKTEPVTAASQLEPGRSQPEPLCSLREQQTASQLWWSQSVSLIDPVWSGEKPN